MVGEVIADRYELEELVGRGGMSSVFRARDRLLERRVALKILHDSHLADSDLTERFRQEARSVAQLSHPNIVTVIDRGESDGRMFIVFEYIEGEDLKALIERTGPLPVRRALEYAIEIARALAFAHAHGIVHRDVKPQNVLLNGDGGAKVTDFGIARAVDVEGVTRTGTILGTSSYIAPEQASGGQVDACTDVYALGVVLFELLTGKIPFEGENFVAIAMRHVHEPAPSVLDRRPDVPLRVAQAVERAMAKDPADRFASMDELLAELEACLAELGSSPADDATLITPGRVVRQGGVHRVRARRRGSPWPLVALIAGLAVIAAIAAVALLTLDESPLSTGGNGKAASPSTSAVRLSGVASYDPEGDGQEHPEAVARATDGDAATYWTTEHYQDFGRTKDGVGLVLDAGGPSAPDAITVETSTPGFTARIEAGSAPSGPFEPVSDAQTVDTSATFELDGTEARYFVVWITEVPDGVARINEVKAS
jgi:eukaryotic-like serine/threonine-protein kinase